MSRSLLFSSRVWHRRVASLLFIFFFLIAATGLMLAWKSLFSTTLYEGKQVMAPGTFKNWLPLDSLEALAARSLTEKAAGPFTHSERADIRLSKGTINFQFKKNYYVQVDGATGRTMLIEQKMGGWLQDLHDGAILDGWISNKSAISKKIYSSVTGLALLFLTISGFYLWYKPKQIRQARKTGKSGKTVEELA
ncbi:MAG TPA: PepSY-associated TM helix domain-containing protein [Puia sp.]|jgi:uncharacterized iron-regulated membrane protein|nr:PepSY-associated TM helix domain-containing protein [Puia sp.]